jgi:hypothetical protein
MSLNQVFAIYFCEYTRRGSFLTPKESDTKAQGCREKQQPWLNEYPQKGILLRRSYINVM